MYGSVLSVPADEQAAHKAIQTKADSGRILVFPSIIYPF